MRPLQLQGHSPAPNASSSPFINTRHLTHVQRSLSGPAHLTLFLPHLSTRTNGQNASQGRLQDPYCRQQGSREEGCRKEAGRLWRQEEAIQDPQGDVQLLHLQGAQAGAPRHWHFQPRHVHPELFCQRYLRACRHRGF